MSIMLKNIETWAVLLLIFCFPPSIFPQSPANDPNWQLNPALSDEFNGSSIDNAKWQLLNCGTPGTINWGGSSAFCSSNAYVSGGFLQFLVDSSAWCFNNSIFSNGIYANGFKTGGIQTNALAPKYGYGYFEISAQLPGFYDKGGNPQGAKYWPAFWTYFDEATLCIHNEIDILEPSGSQYKGTTNVCGSWFMQYVGSSCISTKTGQTSYTNRSPLFAGFHKYAVEWGSNRMIYYFDDVPFAAIYNSPTFIEQGLQAVVIDLQLDGSVGFASDPAQFPQFMKTDYFRYYTLLKDCSNNVTLLSNSDLAAYVYSVKSSIIIGNGIDSVSLNSGDQKYLRAVNTITIYGDFTVPLGAEIDLLPTDCN
jgi:beta-glucanase (GH16 family)